MIYLIFRSYLYIVIVFKYHKYIHKKNYMYYFKKSSTLVELDRTILTYNPKYFWFGYRSGFNNIVFHIALSYKPNILNENTLH